MSFLNSYSLTKALVEDLIVGAGRVPESTEAGQVLISTADPVVNEWVTSPVGTQEVVLNSNTADYTIPASVDAEAFTVLTRGDGAVVNTMEFVAGNIYQITFEVALSPTPDGAFSADVLGIGLTSVLGGQPDLTPYAYNNGILQENNGGQTNQSAIFLAGSFVYKCEEDEEGALYLYIRNTNKSIILPAQPADSATLTSTIIGTFQLPPP